MRKIDKKLTNHSGRKTVVRKMKAGGIPKCEIINVTGHRHERGLDPYDSGDENEQRFWSSVIDKVLFVPVTQSSRSISLPSSAVPQNQFQQLQRNYAPIIAKQSNTSSQVSQVRPLYPRNIMPQPVTNNVGPCNPAFSFNSCQVTINVSTIQIPQSQHQQFDEQLRNTDLNLL